MVASHGTVMFSWFLGFHVTSTWIDFLGFVLCGTKKDRSWNRPYINGMFLKIFLCTGATIRSSFVLHCIIL